MTDLEKIQDILNSLHRSGHIMNGSGYCVAMSELVHRLLALKDIESRMVECEATIMSKNPPRLHTLGYDQLTKGADVDTHVVVVTETNPPYLIDASVYTILAGARPYVLEPLNNGTNGIMGEYTIGNSSWVYRTKEVPRLPLLNEQGLVKRMQTDNQVKNDIHWLKIAVIVAIAISTLNAVRGLYDFYQVYGEQGNFWGPDTLQQIDKKLDTILHQQEPEQLKKRMEGAGFKVTRPLKQPGSSPTE